MASSLPTMSTITIEFRSYRQSSEKVVSIKLQDTFVRAVCALANSEGGRIIIRTKENESYLKKDIDDIVKILEDKSSSVFGFPATRKTISAEKVPTGGLETCELIFRVQRWPSSQQPCTVNYHLYFPTEYSINVIHPSETIQSVIDLVEKKQNSNAVVFEFGSHHRSFPIGEAIPLRESKYTKFKCSKMFKTYPTSIPSCIGKTLTTYVSAFANDGGGHVYYGIDRESVVIGQVMVDNKDKIIHAVMQAIARTIWPKDCGEPRRGEHWQIYFEPVSGIGMEYDNKFVIVIAIAPSSQLVFAEEPESYHMVDGQIERLNYAEWEKRLEEARQIHGFPNVLNWTPISEIHRDKYERLLSTFCGANPTKIEVLDGARVCCKKEFMIGKGCDGTRVYIGLSNNGDERAVKCLLKDVGEKLGLHETKILNEVDSKYVVRYWSYDDKSDERHAYLILSLCEETLEEYVEEKCLDVLMKDAPVIMCQILQGLDDLHRKPKPILHRDLKPSNIMRDVHRKWLLADFGISRILPDGQTTYRSDQTGTDFWRAVESYPPKHKSGNDSTKSNEGSTKSANDSTKSDDHSKKFDDNSTRSSNDSAKSSNDTTKSSNDSMKSSNDSTKSSNDSTKSSNDSTKLKSDDDDSTTSDNDTRYKRQSDIQVAGMVCFYILTNGDHPFGLVADRVRNLLDGRPVGLANLTDPVAKDFISWMLQHNPEDRPYAHEALKHPYLQRPEQQFELLSCVGNQREIKEKYPNSDVVTKLNDDPHELSGSTWKSLIPPVVLAYLCSDGKKNLRYGDEWTECLRLIRNKSQHWNDLPCPRPKVYYEIGELKDYFLTMFPALPVVVHRVIRSKDDWKERAALKHFFYL